MNELFTSGAVGGGRSGNRRLYPDAFLPFEDKVSVKECVQGRAGKRARGQTPLDGKKGTKNMERPFVEANAAERARLRILVSRMSDQQLELPLPNGWPIYAALAHLAFWDQRSTVLVRKWMSEGITASPVDPQVINDALLPFFIHIPPRQAAGLAVTSADAIDILLESASDQLIEGIMALGDRFRLYRCDHRKLHLDKIEKILRASGRPPNQAL